ncbi:acyltransferase [Planctomycetota bacterium]
MRVVYYLLYHLFAKHLPASHCPYAMGAKHVRAWLCRRLFSRCGRNINIEQGADIGTGQHTVIGDNSGIGLRCVVKRAIIGDNVMMGPEVVFVGQNHEFSDPDRPLQQQGYREVPPITVGDNAWIGTRAIILPGRRIGQCTIVGAGAVVTHDVPDYAVVGGNPAHVLYYRNESTSAEQEKAKAVVIEGELSHVSSNPR